MLFWSGFYESAEKNFLPGVHKEYFVFTNHKFFKYCRRKNVHIIHEEMKPWPHATLNRYDFFLKIEDQLSKFDYLFFFNADVLIVDQIHNEILPTKQHNGLVCVRHPWYLGALKKNLPFERRPISTAYVPVRTRRQIYVWGGINGGTAKAFLEMARTISDNTRMDAARGITAIWHDESHFNKYMLYKRPLMLAIEYGVPEGNIFSVRPKIVLRDKRRYGGRHYLRSQESCTNLPFLHPFHIPW